jgi:transcriptional regulator with XRE-family HTH domain
MNDMDQLPYKTLGTMLRRLRERNSESVAEVSGAVEIDESMLDSIEDGRERPSEDILLLLISHFSVGDDKAAEMWQLAGYDKLAIEEEQDSGHEHEREPSGRQQTLMIMIDPRIMYSDSMEVTANRKGVVLNFSQAAGQSDQPLTVARIGMSREQAKLVMSVLHQALYDVDNPRPPRRLGDGSNKQDDK